jgi:hypothetical protein
VGSTVDHSPPLTGSRRPRSLMNELFRPAHGNAHAVLGYGDDHCAGGLTRPTPTSRRSRIHVVMTHLLPESSAGAGGQE